ncbi:hypothetical protein ACFXKS_09930 [Streptomyces scopuliridis]|uniref:hypothetical protein n=1 Tax=Streptomyces scopuliridis TaxID=452529 RepID=UPI0036844065
MTASEARQRLSRLFATFGMNGALVIPKNAPQQPPKLSEPSQPSEPPEPPPPADELSTLSEAELFRRIFGHSPPR